MAMKNMDIGYFTKNRTGGLFWRKQYMRKSTINTFENPLTEVKKVENCGNGDPPKMVIFAFFNRI